MQENKPDIIFLTETHYLPKQHNHLGPLRDGLRDYHLTLSSFNALPAKIPKNQEAVKLYPRAKAGVLLAVRKNLVPAGCDIIRDPTPPELSGYYTSITITSPHGGAFQGCNPIYGPQYATLSSKYPFRYNGFGASL